MMEVCPAISAKDKAEFINFAYRVYRDMPAYRDNMSYAAKDLIYRRSSFSKACQIRPLLIREDGNTVLRCALIAHPGLQAVQVAFFEALPDRQSAVDRMLEAAHEFAGEYNLSALLIGINGHTSYGVGFLCDRFDTPNPFDGVYTPSYYPAYFRELGFLEHHLSTYFVRNLNAPFDKRLLDKVYRRFTFRRANLRNLRGETAILGDLFNRSLEDTPFFYPRPIEEWYEVFHDLKPLLKDENLLYVMSEGKEVGFLFWHPNYNMLLHRNQKSSAAEYYLNYLFRKRHMTELKINAIGILPEYHHSGAIVGLFNELKVMTKDRFQSGETGFVFDDNLPSAQLCRQFCGPAYRHYSMFEIKRKL